MADFIPTASQAAAIHSRGSTVLVSAGAGSGKTKVLTERLMAYITDPEDPADLDSFLIITFTRAAAGELRGRILEELARRLAEDPGSRRLRRQSALCRRAPIGTIHSFCAALLRENSHLAGLSPDFKSLDEDRARSMKAAALERVLDACYEKPESCPGFLLLADTVGAGRDDRRLAELVLNLHEKMQSHARPEQWARQQVELLREPAADAAETPWGQEIQRHARRSVGFWSDQMDRLLEELQADDKLRKGYLPSFAQTADALRELGRCLELGWDKARSALPVPFPRLGGVRDYEDKEKLERIKKRREDCKEAMKRLESSLYADSASLLAEMAETEPAMSALLTVALQFDKAYSRDKQRAGLVDYADLEHKTAAILTDEEGRPTELARRVAARYTEIMVDEYQDVSQVQDTIFRAVSREERNLFLVGDVKQSIYRFRLADPEIFTEKYLRYRDAREAAPGEPRRIDLQENFRSRQEILAGANAVFSRCMSRALGDIDYDQTAALRPGASFQGEGAAPELLLLALPESGEEERPDSAALEADMVARQIQTLVESGMTIQDRGLRRPVRYGDVAILLRSVNTVGGAFRRALTARGVPVATGQGGGFFQSVEVSTVLSLLAVLDNPHQDIPLIAVLRSPAFGFSADELSQIRAADKKGDYFTALTRRAEEDEKCRAFLHLLEELRREAPDRSAAELVEQLLERLDLLAICSAMSDGEQRRARLLALLELAEGFESTGYRGLHRFVLWLRRLAERGQEPSLGADTASAVQILSIHKSKGLEFPVVFLCNTARPFNKQDSRETVLVHPKLGLGPKRTDLERRVEYPTLARNAIKLRLERETLSEEMRLLYVAMTRAKERLVLTAAVKRPEALLEKTAAALTDPLEPELLARAQSPVHWLLSACLADGGEHLKLRILPAARETQDEAEAGETPAADPAVRAELERRLAFRYPYPEAERLPSKVTATELKGRAEPDPDAQALSARGPGGFRLPDFGRELRPLTGAEKGVATHLVLQYMDFAQGGSLEAVQREIQRLRDARFLTEREAQAVDAEAIVKLFASPLGRRMLQAEEIRREFHFSLLCDASELLGSGAGERVLLQGVVDCFIREGGALTVIDYKTDRVRTEAELQSRAAHYTPQLRAYGAALERICGLPVKECVLYFLAAGRAVTLPGTKRD